MSAYRERPSTQIPGVVLWEAVTTITPSRILPDGCMDIIITGDQMVIAGVDTAAWTFTGRLGMRTIGVRFSPGLLPAALGVPADQLADRVVGLDELGVNLFGRISARTFADRVLSTSNPLDRIDAMVAPRVHQTRDPLAGQAAALLKIGVPVAEVAAAIGYSPRQFQRRAMAWFGYGPKHLATVYRLQRALALGPTGLTGAAIAAAAGYADHAHLVRDSQRLGGATFSQLVGEIAGADD